MHPGIVVLLLTIFYFAGLLTGLVLESKDNKRLTVKKPETPLEDSKILLDEHGNAVQFNLICKCLRNLT